MLVLHSMRGETPLDRPRMFMVRSSRSSAACVPVLRNCLEAGLER